MNEMRWLKKQVPIRKEVSPGSYGGAMMDAVETVRVLQYREWRNTINDWTKWFDVPEVDDE